MKKIVLIIIVSVFANLSGYAQKWHKTDSIGDFYVIDHQLVWQRYYDVKSMEALQLELQKHDFTKNLNILGFKKSNLVGPTKISCDGLPMYAQHKFTALIEVFNIQGKTRISVKGFTFPEFVENWYYNGMNTTQGGTLDHYLLRRDGQIKRTDATTRVLDCYGNFFADLFDEAVYQSDQKQ